jgi:hypothetical protein
VSPGSAVYSYTVDRSAFCVAGAATGEWVCNTPHPSFPLADSGQRSCYDTAGNVLSCTDAQVTCEPGLGSWCNQDAQHGWDTTHSHAERFTRHLHVPDQPTVADHVTGLEWQGCVAATEGSDCSLGGLAELDWDVAMSFCDDLTWGGSTDWRLPDRFELNSLMIYEGSDVLDHDVFPGDQMGRLGWGNFWSATSAFQPWSGASQTEEAFYGSFDDGFIQPEAKTSAYTVRCVRSGATVTVVERFSRSVADEPVVVDNATGLTWQGCPAGYRDPNCTTADGGRFPYWNQALRTCTNLSWGGYDDWRLPNVV